MYDVSWLDPERPDERDVAGVVALHEAVRSHDTPEKPPQTLTGFLGTFRYGWEGSPPQVCFVRDADRRIVGVLLVFMFTWDNHHLGMIQIKVDPVRRRRGIGRALVEAALAQLRAAGRTVVTTESVAGSPGVAFAEAMGFTRASVDVERRQDLSELDWARLDAEFDRALPLADGYELVRMPARTPDSEMERMIRLTAAINDRPTGALDIEDEVYSADRIWTFEAVQAARGRRMRRLVARERATGELAGQTIVAVEAEQPAMCMQFDTSVLRAHRGHRLGLLLKLEMLRWLREEEPQLRTMYTGNAADNDHMIHINELLGYRVVATSIEWQRRLG